MKKTFITLAALAAPLAFAATDIYKQSDFKETTVNGYTVGVLTLTKALDFSEDWSLTMTANITNTQAGNQWGTAIIASGSNPLADTFANGFQIYQPTIGTTTDTNAAYMVPVQDSADSEVTYVPQQAVDINGDPMVDGDGKPLYYVSTRPETLLKLNATNDNQKIALGNRLPDNNVVLTFSYDADTRQLSFSCQQLGVTNDAAKVTTISENAAAITQLSTSLGCGQVSDWGIRTLAVTFADPEGSGNIPEPTTATLSLLALAGLAARRRRK